MLKRILSVILVVAMLGSIAVLAASAEESSEKTFNYVALGDSIAAGYGLTAPGTAYDPALILSEDLIANPVVDAYAHVFGERLAELGAEYGYTTTATNLSSTAYRAEDVSKTITTEGYKGVVAAYILDTFVGEGTSDALLAYHGIYNKYLPDADMVSIQLGGNDIVMGIIYPMILSENPILKDAAVAVALLLFGQSPTEALGAGITLILRDKDSITLEHIAEATSFLAAIKDNAENYVLDSAAYVDGVVDAVQDVNPDADIALVGMYNPYGNSLMYDGQVRNLCTVLQNIFVRAAKEAVDVDIPVEEAEIVSDEETEQKIDELGAVAAELTEIAGDDENGYDESIERIKELLTIAADELAYPIQYLTAGKNVDPQMRLLNEKLQEIAEAQGATYVDVYDISNECNTDPHPTAEGHKEIADRLEATMKNTIIKRMDPTAVIDPADDPIEIEPSDDDLIGDVDRDGMITVIDATVIQRILVKLYHEPYCRACADVDGDNCVTILDSTWIMRWLVEIYVAD